MKHVKAILFSILVAFVYGQNESSEEFYRYEYTDQKYMNIRNFEFITSLQDGRSHLCGGAILNNRWILTTAQCASNLIEAYIGDIKLFGYGFFCDIEASYKHPNYVGSPSFAYDIALIKVNRTIPFSVRIQPISLPSSEIKDDEIGVVGGWGHIDDNGTYRHSDDLYTFEPKTLTTSTCRKKIPIDIDDSQICALSKADEGICTGDLGSPYVVKGKLVGLASRPVRFPCSLEYPDIFTNVYFFLDWIKNTMKEH